MPPYLRGEKFQNHGDHEVTELNKFIDQIFEIFLSS
jgi:hypothetical protein